nr:Copia protein [Ipomoea batatas]
MLVPEISQNLLSVGQLLEKGYYVIFKNNKCFINDSCGAELFSVKMKDKSFCLDWDEAGFKAYPCVVSQAELWHKRLGHFHYSTLEYMQKKEIVRGMSFTGGVAAAFEIRQLGKQTRLPFPVGKTWRATEKLQLIHTDVCGGRLKVCRDAKFDETARWNWDKNEPENINEESGEFLDDERIDDIPVRGTRSLTEIYESWSSTKQDVVAQSTAEAEYVAVALVVNQALWLMADLKMTQEEATTIFVDNQAAISSSRNPVFHSKTKHFKVKLYFVREVQKTNEVNLVHCSTGVQLADILTKGLPRSRFEVLREKIGVCSKNSKEE